jgi:hypothetical protein
MSFGGCCSWTLRRGWFDGSVGKKSTAAVDAGAAKVKQRRMRSGETVMMMLVMYRRAVGVTWVR